MLNIITWLVECFKSIMTYILTLSSGKRKNYLFTISYSFRAQNSKIQSEHRKNTGTIDTPSKHIHNSVQTLHSNIPAAAAYGVYISQLIQYSRAYGSYQDFRVLPQTRKLLKQWFLLVYLKSSLRKCYDRHHDLVNRYRPSVTNNHWYVPLVKTSRSVPGAGTACPAGAHEFNPGL